MRLMNVDAYIKEHEEQYKYSDQYETEYFWNAIINAPTIDAVPVVHGKWEIRTTETVKGDVTYIVHEYFCSECGKQAEHFFKYCPNCGAKMDGDV